MISRYTWVEKLTDSWTCRQSISQNLESRVGLGRSGETEYLLAASFELNQTSNRFTWVTTNSFLWYLADTLVVKETQSLMNVNGVVPVMSSHWAGVVPPTHGCKRSDCYIRLWAYVLLVYLQVLCVCVLSNQWYYKAVVMWGCPLRSH